MQPDGAYVDQIPAGAKPPPSSPPAVRIVPGGGATTRPTPPGLYVQIASVADQEQAIRAGLDFAQRLGADRPPFIRGEVSSVEGQRRLLLYAGPFKDGEAARRFCGKALPGQACLGRAFAAPAPAPAGARQTKGPTSAGPQGKGD